MPTRVRLIPRRNGALILIDEMDVGEARRFLRRRADIGLEGFLFARITTVSISDEVQYKSYASSMSCLVLEERACLL